MGDRERRIAGVKRATVGKMGDKERRIAGAERATVGKGARMPEKLNIFVTYNGIKNLISCQKGTSFLKFHDQVQKAFSATGERFTFKEIGGMTDDYVNDQNWEKRLKDAMKLLAIGGKQQIKVPHVIYEDATYQLWSKFSKIGDGIMKRNPDGGVSCDGSDQNSDHHQNTHMTTKDKTQKSEDSPCFAFLFEDEFAIKGDGEGQPITTVGKDSSDYKGKIVVLEPQYHGGSTMLKLYGTDLYVGCDRKGVTTLIKSVDPTNPSPKILFHAERVR